MTPRFQDCAQEVKIFSYRPAAEPRNVARKKGKELNGRSTHRNIAPEFYAKPTMINSSGAAPPSNIRALFLVTLRGAAAGR
jgi:hypothetical protein